MQRKFLRRVERKYNSSIIKYFSKDIKFQTRQERKRKKKQLQGTEVTSYRIKTEKLIHKTFLRDIISILK